MDLGKEFSRNFIRAREARGLRRCDVADALGVHRARVFDWEHGRLPRGATLDRIAKVLRVTVGELLGFS